jgi:hypothetical protein
VNFRNTYFKNKCYKQHLNNRIFNFNRFVEEEIFEIFKQANEDEKLIRYFLFQFKIHIITKCGLASTTTFHK